MKDREISVITYGMFLDTDPGFGNKIFKIRVWTVRVGPQLLNDWMWSEHVDFRACFPTQEEYDAHVAEKTQQHEAVKREFSTALGIQTGWSCAVTQNVAEIFTVVSMEAIQCRS